MNKHTITIAECDDWQGLYVDGKLVNEDHKIKTKDALEAASKFGTSFDYKVAEVDYEWLDELGSMPELESDIKWSTE